MCDMQKIDIKVRHALLDEHGVEANQGNNTAFQKALCSKLPDDLLAAIVAQQDQQQRMRLHGGVASTEAQQAQALQNLRNAARAAQNQDEEGIDLDSLHVTCAVKCVDALCSQIRMQVVAQIIVNIARHHKSATVANDMQMHVLRLRLLTMFPEQCLAVTTLCKSMALMESPLLLPVPAQQSMRPS